MKRALVQRTFSEAIAPCAAVRRSVRRLDVVAPHDGRTACCVLSAFSSNATVESNQIVYSENQLLVN